MKGRFLTIVLAIIIILLLIYICCFTNVLPSKNKIVSNKALKVIDSAMFPEYEDSKMLVLKVKNTSTQDFKNVNPYIIYYDSNNMPVYETGAAAVRYFKSGETRCFEFYNPMEEYSRMEVGLYENEYYKEDVNVEDLRDKISFEVGNPEKAEEIEGQILRFKGQNNSDKDASVVFQIEYFSGAKLIYEDEFMTVIDANSPMEDTYEMFMTKYYDGTEFPAGYTYKVSLVEAVEFKEDDSIKEYDEEVGYADTVNTIDTFDENLSTEDQIEIALHALFKETYGNKIEAAKIYVDKVYDSKQAKEKEEMADLNLKEDEYAFEVTYDLLPAEGTDPNELSIPNGEYNEENGWVMNNTRIGTLRLNDSEDTKYKIEDFGTGW